MQQFLASERCLNPCSQFTILSIAFPFQLNSKGNPDVYLNIHNTTAVRAGRIIDTCVHFTLHSS